MNKKKRIIKYLILLVLMTIIGVSSYNYFVGNWFPNLNPMLKKKIETSFLASSGTRVSFEGKSSKPYDIKIHDTEKIDSSLFVIYSYEPEENNVCSDWAVTLLDKSENIIIVEPNFRYHSRCISNIKTYRQMVGDVQYILIVGYNEKGYDELSLESAKDGSKKKVFDISNKVYFIFSYKENDFSEDVNINFE
ncbi:hypothetical protein [Haloplasma contractile]|uniref:Uncharacterized protein n=1 Tax=Haloplasma contractile SSD-17B TaxID=1033810 RepID=U2EAK4_9MOLU|nr:hypothetical protein [Haloplasma contractile]ERJ11856.1 hypothetical protein HLPCO_002096 [Haloplasma contractile SSD-17B]